MLLSQRLGKPMSAQAYYNTLSELIWLEPREAKCCSKTWVSSDASVGSPSHLHRQQCFFPLLGLHSLGNYLDELSINYLFMML